MWNPVTITALISSVTAAIVAITGLVKAVKTDARTQQVSQLVKTHIEVESEGGSGSGSK